MAGQKMITLLVIGLLFVVNQHLSEAHIGVTYGTLGNNLAAPEKVVGVLVANNISRVRLLEPNKEILTALKGTNIEVMLGIPNKAVIAMNGTQEMTDKWVAENVTAFVPDVKIKYIVVGSEVSRNNDLFRVTDSAFFVMKQFQTALQKAGLKDIKITTSCDRSVLDELNQSLVPSAAKFWQFSRDVLAPILAFLKENGSPFLTSIYPYYERVKFPDDNKPEFALFTANGGHVLTDGNLRYENKFDVMLDAFYTALEKANHSDMDIIVSETGWPSAGGIDASLENEKTYIYNLVRHVNKGTGTPKRPLKPIQVYINLIDENERGIPVMEKNFGVLTSDANVKFPINFNSKS